VIGQLVVRGSTHFVADSSTGYRLRAFSLTIQRAKRIREFIRSGDELLFPLEHQATRARTQIYIRNINPRERGQDTFQAEIGYARMPGKTREVILVSAEMARGCPGISAIQLRCEALKDYFYVGSRRAWDRQPSFYELLGVDTSAAPAELRFAFKLRTLEPPMHRSASFVH
jgi:hypothetical protein